MLWVQFIVCAALVIVAGTVLSRSADMLAEKTGLGRSWVGAILLAGATSLPELATGISAVRVVGDVNLAAGGILGSCLFNLVLLALLDLNNNPVPLLKRAEVSHILAAGLGILLLSIVSLGIVTTQTLALPALGWIGFPSLLILGAYILSVRIISFFEQRRAQESTEQTSASIYAAVSLRRAMGMFVSSALAIALLGLWLAALGEQITVATGLGASFVGAIFLAITTSLPDVVASIAALRMGAVDLAVANVFGSNIFNIAALAIYDVVYVEGDMWRDLQPIHSFTATAAAAMTALVIISLIYQVTKKPRWLVSWEAVVLLLSYGGSMYVVYAVSG